MFTRINCKLGLLGQDPVDVPPAAPQFPALAPKGLVITNTGGVIADEPAGQVTVAVNRVLHGPEHPSRLILPVISR